MRKKSLGQHFLRSKKALATIISCARLSARDVVFEIGPGEGVLTQELLNTGAKVVAVEKDDVLIPLLHEKFKKEISEKRLTVVHGDILKISTAEYAQTPFVLVANIPYYITGAILRMFLSGSVQPTQAVLLVQKEVAERIVSRDGKESILSLSVKAYGVPEYIETVKAGSFSPPPKVDSAILYVGGISKNQFKSPAHEHNFFVAVRAGFKSKRKQLVNNLESLIEKEALIALLKQYSLSPLVRAEDVPLSVWFEIAQRIKYQPL